MTRHLKKFNQSPARRHLKGFGLVELMIALALGLFLVGGAISVFLNNQQAYRATEQLARMQESGRTSVELMARQLREAGGSPCGRGILTGNTVNNSGTFWWANWGEGIRGYDNNVAADGVATGTGAAQRIAGTDAVFMTFANASSGAAIASHAPATAALELVNANHGLNTGDIVLVCNYRQAAVLQLTNASDASPTVQHINGAGTPGNCSMGLGFPTDCGTALGAQYSFNDGYALRLSSEIWYVGANGRGGNSLYRARMANVAGTPTTVSEEIAEGVTDLQLTYLQLDAAGAPAADYVDASAVTAWEDVSAVRVTLTLQSLQNVGTDGAPLQRQMTHVVTLRNRLP
jgi:type IV pilus assembly protein PilW